MIGYLHRFKSLSFIDVINNRLAKSDIVKRFSTGSFWLLLGDLGWRIPAAVSTLLVARILGPIGFGAFGMINSTINMFQLYAGMRLGATSAKYISQHRLENPEKAARILKLTLSLSFISCLSMGLTLLLLSPYLASTMLDRPGLTIGLAIGGGLLFFRVYGSVQEFGLIGFESFQAIAKINAIRGFATALLTIPFALIWGVNGVLSALLVVAIVTFFLLVKQLREEKARAGFRISVRLRDTREEVPILWTYALPGLLTSTLVTGSQLLGRTLLVRKDAGLSELGLFEAANQWRTVLLFLPTIIARVMLPILAESHSNKVGKNFKNAMSLQLRAICIATVPLVIIMLGCTDLLAMVFGENFAETNRVMPILIISIFFTALNQALRIGYDGAGQRWRNFIMHTVWAAVFIGLCWRGGLDFGFEGLAWAHLGSELALFLIQALYVDAVLAQGVIREQAVLLTYYILTIGMQYLIWIYFPTAFSVTMSVVLSAVSLLPVLRLQPPGLLVSRGRSV